MSVRPITDTPRHIGGAYRIDARPRYRVRDGKLTFQGFDDGYQGAGGKGLEGRARAFR